MATKKDHNNNAPAWARRDGVQYTTGFHGTPEQKKERDRVVAEVLSGKGKEKRGGKK